MLSFLAITRNSRNHILSAILLSLVLGCEKPQPVDQPPTTSPLRVMSYNIRYNNPNDGQHAWPNRVERVASTIEFNDADLVGVQEALKGQMDDLASALETYAWTGVGRDDGKEAGEYAAIFYKTDRFDLIDAGTFWLSKNPDIPGSKDWDAALTRIASWGQFKDKSSGATFYHYNTHFDHRGAEAREKSASLIAHRATRSAGDTPLVVTGDFNFTEDKAGYTALTNELSDAFYVSAQPHHGPDATIYGGFEVTHKAGRRIDYIFVNDGFKVMQHATLSDNWEGAFASDHLAVMATLTIQ